jgi:hypothetical protein
VSYQFSTSGHYLTAAAPVSGGSSFSMACWAYLTSHADSRVPLAMDRDDGTDSDSVYIVHASGIGGPALRNASGVDTSFETNAAWTTGSWGLFGAVYAHSGGNYTTTGWRNTSGTAVAASTSAARGFSASFPTTLRVGRYPSTAYITVGYVAEVSIWDRALVQADWDALYASTARKVASDRGITANLKAYYPLSTDANYLSYGTNNLTVTGATLQSGTHPTLADSSSSVVPGIWLSRQNRAFGSARQRYT